MDTRRFGAGAGAGKMPMYFCWGYLANEYLDDLYSPKIWSKMRSTPKYFAAMAE